jgi:hypothetical protein
MIGEGGPEALGVEKNLQRRASVLIRADRPFAAAHTKVRRSRGAQRTSASLRPHQLGELRPALS